MRTWDHSDITTCRYCGNVAGFKPESFKGNKLTCETCGRSFYVRITVWLYLLVILIGTIFTILFFLILDYVTKK